MTVHRSSAVAAVVFIAALALYTAIAAPSITSRFDGSNGGELAVTAMSDGVPHPSGYPTYMLLTCAPFLA